MLEYELKDDIVTILKEKKPKSLDELATLYDSAYTEKVKFTNTASVELPKAFEDMYKIYKLINQSK